MRRPLPFRVHSANGVNLAAEIAPWRRSGYFDHLIAARFNHGRRTRIFNIDRPVTPPLIIRPAGIAI
jgi:hypothetical protein